MVPLNLAGVLMDPVEQGELEVLVVVVSESSGVSPLGRLVKHAPGEFFSTWDSVACLYITYTLLCGLVANFVLIL